MDFQGIEVLGMTLSLQAFQLTRKPKLFYFNSLFTKYCFRHYWKQKSLEHFMHFQRMPILDRKAKKLLWRHSIYIRTISSYHPLCTLLKLVALVLAHLISAPDQKLMYVQYGNTGCGVFKWGIQNQKDFCIKINIPKRK